MGNICPTCGSPDTERKFCIICKRDHLEAFLNPCRDSWHKYIEYAVPRLIENQPKG